ncbi:MAG: hypothetical protein RLZZ436_2040 [Planctomycetota bacterium]
MSAPEQDASASMGTAVNAVAKMPIADKLGRAFFAGAKFGRPAATGVEFAVQSTHNEAVNFAAEKLSPLFHS